MKRLLNPLRIRLLLWLAGGHTVMLNVRAVNGMIHHGSWCVIINNKFVEEVAEHPDFVQLFPRA